MPADKDYGNGYDALKQGGYTVCNTNTRYRPSKNLTDAIMNTYTTAVRTATTSTANCAMPYAGVKMED